MQTNRSQAFRCLLCWGFVSVAVALSGCGTTSGLEPVGGAEEIPSGKRFEKVIVNDVVTRDAQTDASPERVALAGEELREMIVTELETTGAFNEVRTGGAVDAGTIVLNSEVIKYQDGNAVARLLVGFGAGSSRFDAIFKVRDGGNGDVVGRIVADKNSWVLGGGLAAGQDADSYMPGIAEKVASELAVLGVNYVESAN